MLWEFLSVTQLNPGLVLFSLLFLFLPVGQLNMLFKVHFLVLSLYFHWSFTLESPVPLSCSFVLLLWFLLKTPCSFLKVLTDWLLTLHFMLSVEGSNLRVRPPCKPKLCQEILQAQLTFQPWANEVIYWCFFPFLPSCSVCILPFRQICPEVVLFCLLLPIHYCPCSHHKTKTVL